MKKKIWIPVLFLAIIIGGVYLFIKLNSPLEIGTLASTGDNKSAVVGVGNKGFREIKIVDVTVNNGEKPMTTRLQVSNALQGFIITNEDTDEKANNNFTDIGKVAIKTGTSRSSNFEKINNGATINDEIYGIRVYHNEEINKVHIKYKYLGILFNETVILN